MDHTKLVISWLYSLSQEDLCQVLTDYNQEECDRLRAMYQRYKNHGLCLFLPQDDSFGPNSDAYTESNGFQQSKNTSKNIKTQIKHLEYRPRKEIQHCFLESDDMVDEAEQRILNLIRFCRSTVDYDTYTIETNAITTKKLLETLSILTQKSFLSVYCHLVWESSVKEFRSETPGWFTSKGFFSLGDYIAVLFEKLIWTRYCKEHHIDAPSSSTTTSTTSSSSSSSTSTATSNITPSTNHNGMIGYGSIGNISATSTIPFISSSLSTTMITSNILASSLGSISIATTNSSGSASGSSGGRSRSSSLSNPNNFKKDRRGGTLRVLDPRKKDLKNFWEKLSIVEREKFASGKLGNILIQSLREETKTESQYYEQLDKLLQMLKLNFDYQSNLNLNNNNNSNNNNQVNQNNNNNGDNNTSSSVNTTPSPTSSSILNNDSNNNNINSNSNNNSSSNVITSVSTSTSSSAPGSSTKKKSSKDTSKSTLFLTNSIASTSTGSLQYPPSTSSSSTTTPSTTLTTSSYISQIKSIIEEALIRHPGRFVEFLFFSPLDRAGSIIDNTMRRIGKDLQDFFSNKLSIDLISPTNKPSGGKSSGGGGSSGGTPVKKKKKKSTSSTTVHSSLSSSKDSISSGSSIQKDGANSSTGVGTVGTSGIGTGSGANGVTSTESKQTRKKKKKKEKKKKIKSSTVEDNIMSEDPDIETIQTRPRRHSLPMEVESIKGTGAPIMSTTEDEDSIYHASEGDLDYDYYPYPSNNIIDQMSRNISSTSNERIITKGSSTKKSTFVTNQQPSSGIQQQQKFHQHHHDQSNTKQSYLYEEENEEETNMMAIKYDDDLDYELSIEDDENDEQEEDGAEEEQEQDLMRIDFFSQISLRPSKPLDHPHIVQEKMTDDEEDEEEEEIKDQLSFISTPSIAKPSNPHPHNQPPLSIQGNSGIVKSLSRSFEGLSTSQSVNSSSPSTSPSSSTTSNPTTQASNNTSGKKLFVKSSSTQNVPSTSSASTPSNSSNTSTSPKKLGVNTIYGQHFKPAPSSKQPSTQSYKPALFVNSNPQPKLPIHQSQQHNQQPKQSTSATSSLPPITNPNAIFNFKKPFIYGQSSSFSQMVIGSMNNNNNNTNTNNNNNNNNFPTLQQNTQTTTTTSTTKLGVKTHYGSSNPSSSSTQSSSTSTTTSDQLIKQTDQTKKDEEKEECDDNENHVQQRQQPKNTTTTQSIKQDSGKDEEEGGEIEIVEQTEDKYKDWRHNKLFNQIQLYKQSNSSPLQVYLQPWYDPPLPYPHPLFSIKLHQEILDFVSDVGDRTYPHVQSCHQVIALIKSVVKRLWPNAEIDIYGSFMTGLWLPSSDIDIVVDYNKNMSIGPKNAQFLLEVLEKQIRHDLNSYILTMLCIPSAKIPVIKLVTKENIAVDISFRESPTSPHTGIAARDLVADNVKKVIGLYPLAIVLKWFLRDRGLNNTYSGGLSSYCLVLMLISFLKNNEHCPKHSKLTTTTTTNDTDPNHDHSNGNENDDKTREVNNEDSSNNSNNDTNNNNNNNNNQNIGPTLRAKPCKCDYTDSISGLNIGCALMRFLEYYGVNFNYATTGISIEESRYTFPLDELDNSTSSTTTTTTTTTTTGVPRDFSTFLYVSDPFAPGRNVAAGSFNFGRVKAAFQYAFVTLSNASMKESFERESILSKIMTPDKKF